MASTVATLIGGGAFGAAATFGGTFLKARGELKVKNAEIDDLKVQRSERARQERGQKYAALNANLDSAQAIAADGGGGDNYLSVYQRDELAPLRDAIAGVEAYGTPAAAEAAASIRTWILGHQSGSADIDDVWLANRRALSDAIRADPVS